MKRHKILVICASIFLSGAFIFGAQARAATQDEIAKAEKELAAAKKDLEAYRSKLAENPAVANLRKEIAALEASAKAKAKELESLLNTRMNKEPAFLELTAKAKELEGVNKELAEIRARLDKDPEVAKIKKDAAYMRTRAAEFDKEAKKLLDAKFNSDEKAKELTAKQAALKNVPRDVANFRKDVMNSPEVRTLQQEVDRLKKGLGSKSIELGKATRETAKALKEDKRLKSLESKVKDLGQKLASLKKTPVPAASAKAQAAKPAIKAQAKTGGLREKLSNFFRKK